MNTAEQTLLLLKTRGAQTAQALADTLHLTSMGVRRQLEAAEEKGLVSHVDTAGKVGRPVRLWQLTELGHARFPDRHAALTVDLIAQVRTLFGESAIDRLIDAREAASETAYCAAALDDTRTGRPGSSIAMVLPGIGSPSTSMAPIGAYTALSSGRPPSSIDAPGASCTSR